MIPVSSSLQPDSSQLARFLRETGRPTLEISGPPKALPTFEVGEEITAKIVDTYGSNRFTVLVKDKLMTLNLDRRHAFAGEAGGSIKLVVATIEPKLSFAMDAKAPMHMPDSSSKVLLSPATRYLSTLLFVASGGGEETADAGGGGLPQMYSRPGTGIATVTSALANAMAAAAPADTAHSAAQPATTGGAAAAKPPLPSGIASAEVPVRVNVPNVPVAGAPSSATAASEKASAATSASSSAVARFPAALASLLGGDKTAQQTKAAAVAPLFEQMDTLSTTGMAQLLKQAVSRSGVFYESHLAEWSQGSRSLHAIRQEPQAVLKLPEKLAELGKPTALDNPAIQEAVKTGSATGLRDRELFNLRNDSNTTQLGQLVHRQLDALDQQQFTWQGMAWPGQPMDWRIEQEKVDQREAHGDGEQFGNWSTSLALELPNLGGLAAKISLSSAGLMIRFQTDSSETANAIDQNQSRLREALTNAGLSLLTFSVQKGDENGH